MPKDSCGHSHCRDHSKENGNKGLTRTLLILGLGVILYCGALWANASSQIKFFLYLSSYIVIAGDIVWRGFRNIFHRQIFDENFLMSVASIGAFAIKQFPEAVGVMIFYKVGEFFQELAVTRSRKSIKSLLAIKPDYANVKINGQVQKIDPNQADIGQIIIVRPGERIPLDGTVEEGEALIDTSALTGESVPRTAKKNDAVYSGSINKNGILNIRVTKKFGESTVSRILELVENTAAKKSSTENFITKFARYYTPAVVSIAALMAVVPVLLYKLPALAGFFHHQEIFSEWIYRALVFLVISCPCALVISIPLGFFGGIGACSRKGILVKGANYLEALNSLSTVVWDKTGTLTKGVFKVTEIISQNGFPKERILRLAALAESHSSHPIAESIKEAFKGEIGDTKIKNYEEIPGHGIKAEINGSKVFIGNDKLLHKENIEHDLCDVGGTVVHVVIDRKYAGYILISDEIKHDAEEAIQKLKQLGIKTQLMLTGDNERTGKIVSEQLGLDGYFAELLPHQKVEKVEEIMNKRKNPKDLVAVVGDGINDAPVLTRSDIGVAMGALGSEAAIEAADIVFMNDQPSKLFEAVQIAKRTRHIVWQNIILAFGVKIIFLTIGAIGIATMWEAVFADMGVALVAIFNASRILYTASPQIK